MDSIKHNLYNGFAFQGYFVIIVKTFLKQNNVFAIIPKCLLYTYTWPGPYLIILLVDIENTSAG